jgi:hypothetical protein
MRRLSALNGLARRAVSQLSLGDSLSGRAIPLESAFAAMADGGQTGAPCPSLAAGSTDRCNTFCELLSWSLIEQGLSRSFIELPCDCAELGLAMHG